MNTNRLYNPNLDKNGISDNYRLHVTSHAITCKYNNNV